MLLLLQAQRQGPRANNGWRALRFALGPAAVLRYYDLTADSGGPPLGTLPVRTLAPVPRCNYNHISSTRMQNQYLSHLHLAVY